MKLCIVYGTRPEFLKLKILIDHIKQHNRIELKVIKINQHTEILDDNIYYDDILYINSTTSSRLSNIGADILLQLPSLINDYTHILAQGDTASVFYSLLCGFQMKKTCIHLEGGMRTYDLENPFPEEGYRQMISRITDIHLCPSEIEKNNLINEKVKGKIFVVGNTILDLVKSYDIPITYENDVLITLHRRENWNDYKEYLQKICLLASKHTNITFTFLAHYNPSLQSILKTIEHIPSNFNILQPLIHNELIKKLSSCLCVITDSGGIQEEANFVGKHIYVLRKVTERNAISNTNMTLCSIDNIIDIDIYKKGDRGFEYGKGDSCNYIIQLF